MVPLHKFKLLATKCTVLQSPTRSPSSSPVVHLRRRKTLRMFLSTNDRRLPHRDDTYSTTEVNGGEEIPVSRHKLKDLLMISSPPFEDAEKKKEGEEEEEILPAAGNFGGGFGWRQRNLSAKLFRNRLLRRPWRPVLVAIAE